MQAKEDVVFCLADDLYFRTLNWDLAFEAFATTSRPAAFFTNDGAITPKQATHLGVNRGWLNEFGSIWTPKIRHFYADTWVQEVAEKGKALYYLSNVNTEHMHPKYNKGKWDQTYWDARNAERQVEDRAIYKATAGERTDWSSRILGYPEGDGIRETEHLRLTGNKLPKDGDNVQSS